eukprot:1159991-Pelagomonas_calceolata.AAC.4
MVGAALQCCMPAAPAAAAAAAAERPQWERLCCLHLPAHHPHTCCQRFCSAWLVQRGVSHSHRGSCPSRNYAAALAAGLLAA